MSKGDPLEEPVTAASISNKDVYTLLTEIPPVRFPHMGTLQRHWDIRKPLD
jgi:hypothetical protein